MTVFVCWILCLALSLERLEAQKLNLEEVVRKHLESLGSQEALAARTSTAGNAVGRVHLIVGGSGYVEGPAVFASQGSRTALLIDFGQATYQKEHFIFDGEEVQIGRMVPGQFSPLGEFLLTYRHIMKDGLFGGVLSAHWPLTDAELRGANIKYQGIKKVEGDRFHRLEYRPKGGSDAVIRLFMDDQTFRHVRSEYEVTIAPSIGLRPDSSPGQRRTRTKVVEVFSDFRDIQGLTVPTVWEINFDSSGSRQAVIWKWTIRFNEMAHNQPVEEKFFSLQRASLGPR